MVHSNDLKILVIDENFIKFFFIDRGFFFISYALSYAIILGV